MTAAIELALVMLNFIDTIKEKIFGVTDTISLLVLGFKLIVLLFIVSFVRNRFGSGPVVTVLVLVLGYIILFQNWMMFGPMMIFYFFIIFGFSAILFDLSISAPWTWRHSPKGEMGGGGGENPADSFRDFEQRQQRVGRFRGRF